MIIKSNFLKLLIFLLVLFFTFILRAHNYDRTPGTGHLEEMLYGWSGMYLIETGTPVSWSTLEYPDRAEVFRGQKTTGGGDPKASVRLYKPWLDEPPLFSLLVGYYAHIFGANRQDVIPSSFLRFPVIFISTLTSVFIFLVARMIFGYWIGISSMLFYGLTPIIVFASRLAVPENLIALLFMIMLYLLFRYYQQPKFLYLIPIPFLAGIAGLSKPTGYFILPLAIFLVLLTWYKDKFKKSKLVSNLLYLILLTIPFILAFVWYGTYYDSEIFWRIVSIQGFRPVGFSSLAYFLTTPAYDIFEITDSWYVFALASAIFYIFAIKKEGLEKLLSFAFVYWLIIVILSGGEADLLPWYRFPSFPILAILGSLGIVYLVKKADFFASFLIIGMMLGGRFLLVGAFRPNIHAPEFRLIFSALMLPSTMNFIFNKRNLEKFNRLIIIGVILVGAYFNMAYIYNRYDLDCQSISCAMGPSTWVSEIRIPFFWRFMVLGESKYK